MGNSLIIIENMPNILTSIFRDWQELFCQCLSSEKIYIYWKIIHSLGKFLNKSNSRKDVFARSENFYKINFDSIGILQSSDLWGYLYPEKVCKIISNLTDIFDIFRVLRTSTVLVGHGFCVRNLILNRMVMISPPVLFIFMDTQMIDHKTVITVDEHNLPIINSLNNLYQAYFLIDSILLESSIRSLTGLRLPYRHFKNFMTLPDRIVIVLVLNGVILVFINGDIYKKKLGQIIAATNLNLGQIISRQFVLLKGSMKYFLRKVDFGLINLVLSWSEINLPLSNYIIAVSDVGPSYLISLIFRLYVI